MYFWKIGRLKKQLVEQGLSKRQLYYYILISVVINAAVIEIMAYGAPKVATTWDYVFSLVNIGIAIIGTWAIYRANGGDNGVQFAERFFSIGLVAIVRFVAVTAPVMIALMIYLFPPPETADSVPLSPTEVVMWALWYAAAYAYIVKHVHDLQRPPTASP